MLTTKDSNCSISLSELIAFFSEQSIVQRRCLLNPILVLIFI